MQQFAWAATGIPSQIRLFYNNVVFYNTGSSLRLRLFISLPILLLSESYLEAICRSISQLVSNNGQQLAEVSHGHEDNKYFW